MTGNNTTSKVLVRIIVWLYAAGETAGVLTRNSCNGGLPSIGDCGLTTGMLIIIHGTRKRSKRGELTASEEILKAKATKWWKAKKIVYVKDGKAIRK